MLAMLTRQRSEEAKRLRRIIGEHVPFHFKQPRIRTDNISNAVTTFVTKDNQILEIYRVDR